MPRRWSFTRIAGLAGAGLLLGACTREAPVGPEIAPSLDVGVAALEVDVEAMPDSGEIVLYPSGAVADLDVDADPVARGAREDEGAGLLRLAAAAAVAEPTIRIGVVQTAESITLGSATDYVVKDRAGGVTLFTGSNGAVVVKLESVIVSNYRLQISCGTAAAIDALKAQAEAKGYVTFTNFNATAKCTRLFIGVFAPPPANTFTARSNFRSAAITAGIAKNDSFWVVVGIGNTLFSVQQGTTVKYNVDPVVITSADGIVTINGARYRDRGEARTNGAGKMAGVNELPIEQYLYGVVPRELGPIAFPEVEAQRAQAVAARTYAISGLGKRVADGYDLRATTDDQVYGGYAAEHPTSTKAVEDTRGVVATYEGKLIQALFSSTSGGHTADSEEAFNSAPVPYLRGVVDSDKKYPPGLTVTKEAIRGSDDLRILRQTRTQDFETEWASRFHRWTFEWTQAEMVSVLKATVDEGITTVYEINELSRGPSGRVVVLEYVTNVGRDTVRRDAIRSSLKFIDANGAQQSLLSTLFFIETTDGKGHEVRRQSYGANEAPIPAGFRVYGAGWGHGVGLAQTGAVGMAQAGYSYDAILKRYYTGIDLVPGYNK